MNHGSIFAVAVLILLGAVMFSGIGLLIASRAKTIEAVSGLMNLVQLPMWIVSGIFFSSERFPEAVQPLIRALPLTPLIDSLRSVMLEGASSGAQLPRIGVMVALGRRQLCAGTALVPLAISHTGSGVVFASPLSNTNPPSRKQLPTPWRNSLNRLTPRRNRFDAKPLRRFPAPSRFPKWRTTKHRAAQCLQFCLGLDGVHIFQPLIRPRHRPGGERYVAALESPLPQT